MGRKTLDGNFTLEFEGLNVKMKKRFMRKTKKELVDLLTMKRQLNRNKITIYHGENELISYEPEKDWAATTLSMYHHRAEDGQFMIDEVCIWERHMIDELKEEKKSKSFMKRLAHWFKFS